METTAFLVQHEDSILGASPGVKSLAGSLNYKAQSSLAASCGCCQAPAVVMQYRT
jgi:hypothetical protein